MDDQVAAEQHRYVAFAIKFNWCRPTMESGMIIALSRFTIANDMAEDVRQAFMDRPHLVDNAEGFLGMEVMSPAGDEREIWLVTRWVDEQRYREWHRSHDYHDSHKGIPKGLKLVPGSASVQILQVFAQ
ncbi:MAG: antibiotic biosynthesis monooxygenase [Dehalococcoidia bacterium]|nr:antibiotic biosynthesis monooxygenase [Dehalococcoidia bacterium]